MERLTLTERELEIIKLVAEGKTNGRISDMLYISVHTVKSHLEELYRKFFVHNRVQLVVSAIRAGVIKIEQ